jgi:hypothetical protein
MKSDGRIALDTFPQDWKYYTLTFPVARCKHLPLDSIIEEMISCDRKFYSMPGILRRAWSTLCRRRAPLLALLGALSYRSNLRLNCRAYAEFKSQRGHRFPGRVDVAASVARTCSSRSAVFDPLFREPRIPKTQNPAEKVITIPKATA